MKYLMIKYMCISCGFVCGVGLLRPEYQKKPVIYLKYPNGEKSQNWRWIVCDTCKKHRIIHAGDFRIDPRQCYVCDNETFVDFVGEFLGLKVKPYYRSCVKPALPSFPDLLKKYSLGN